MPWKELLDVRRVIGKWSGGSPEKSIHATAAKRACVSSRSLAQRPTLCPQGSTPWTRADLEAAVPDFVRVFERRPIQRNDGGMQVNHAFALWFILTWLKPPVVIENGLFRGQGTWLVRQALGPHARIICLDPLPDLVGAAVQHCKQARCSSHMMYHPPGHHATHGSVYFDANATYAVGEDFVDFGNVDWHEWIPARGMRERALVIFDDHMSAIRRTLQAQSFGFQHLYYDDNDDAEGCYSFHAMCTPPRDDAAATVTYMDHFMTTKIQLPAAEHEANSRFLAHHLAAYFEFPPIGDLCEPPGVEDGTFSTPRYGRPLLNSSTAALWFGDQRPVSDAGRILFSTQFPPYVRVRPMAARDTCEAMWLLNQTTPFRRGDVASMCAHRRAPATNP